MTSILTNNGAQIALQTLTQINKDLTEVQGQISTGKRVADAADNASIFAVTSVMKADVAGFNAISEALSLGKATVSVARNASEKVIELLQETKEKVVAAQGENIDRAKIQTDISELTSQIDTIVNSAQFNGLNLLDGSATGSVNVLSSLDRAADGTVSSSSISVDRQDLSVGNVTFGTTNTSLATTDITVSNNIGTASATVGFVVAGTVASNTVTVQIGDLFTSSAITVAGTTAALQAASIATQLQAQLDAAGLTDVAVTDSGTGINFSNDNNFADFDVTFTVTGTDTTIDGNATATSNLEQQGEKVTLLNRDVAEGDSYRLTLTPTGGAAVDFEVVASASDDLNDIAAQFKTLIENDSRFSDIEVNLELAGDPVSENVSIELGLASGASLTSVATAVTANDGGTAGGGLGLLSRIDVDDTGAAGDQLRADALRDIEVLIQNAVDAAAAFGSVESRIDIQTDFVSSLIDSLNSGIGALIDTDLEKASARLQALQVQQQLGTQALAIANSSPQNVLSLFQ